MSIVHRSDTAPFPPGYGPDHLGRHRQSCWRCQDRYERDVRLYRLRRDARITGMSYPGTVRYTCLMTPMGLLWIGLGERGLVRVSFEENELAFCTAIERAGHGIPVYAPEELEGIAEQFLEFFGGERRTFELEIDLSALAPFQRAVLEAVHAVPFGKTRSYGEIAQDAGKPRAARAAGTALGMNPVTLVIPCHRIIRSDGSLGEYGYGSLGPCGRKYKSMLLALEGTDCPPSVDPPRRYAYR